MMEISAVGWGAANLKLVRPLGKYECLMDVVRSVLSLRGKGPSASKTSSTIRTQNHSKENDAPNSSAPWKNDQQPMWIWVDIKYQKTGEFIQIRKQWKSCKDRWNAHHGVFCQWVPRCTWAINVGSNVLPWGLHHFVNNNHLNSGRVLDVFPWLLAPQVMNYA